jgi:hypothetical protein
MSAPFRPSPVWPKTFPQAAAVTSMQSMQLVSHGGDPVKRVLGLRGAIDGFPKTTEFGDVLDTIEWKNAGPDALIVTAFYKHPPRPLSKVVPIEEHWTCAYCRSLMPIIRTRCDNCGAPVLSG